MKFWNDPEWVAKTPLVTVGLFESANVGQIVRMLTHHTAAGQSLVSWVSVNAALWAWANFYRVMDSCGCTHERNHHDFNSDHECFVCDCMRYRGKFRFARWTLKVGICLNMIVIATVAYFRAIGRG